MAGAPAWVTIFSLLVSIFGRTDDLDAGRQPEFEPSQLAPGPGLGWQLGAALQGFSELSRVFGSRRPARGRLSG